MMDHTDSLPTDLAECHRLLLAAYQQTVQLKGQAAESERRATESERRIAELDRVLDATPLPTRNFSTSMRRHWRSLPGTSAGSTVVGVSG